VVEPRGKHLTPHPPPPSAPGAPTAEISGEGADKSLLQGPKLPSPSFFRLVVIARELYLRGFNVVPVDREKRPLLGWSWESRPSWEELEKVMASRPSEVAGLAICAGPRNPKEPVCWLILGDVDDPRVVDESSLLKELLKATVSWRTGPRCPKCGQKHVEVLEPGRVFRCPKCVMTFKAEEALRGLGFMSYVSSDLVDKYLRGTLRGRAVELLVKNYQLVPPSLHPSGVEYEWVKPIDFKDTDLGIRTLTEEELLELLREIGVIKGESEPRARREGAERPKKFRELSDAQLLKVEELLKPAYRPGDRQFMWLYVAGYGAKARISPVSIAKLLKMLYDETGDGDDMRTRASALVYSYKKAGVDLEPYAEDLKQLLGVEPYGLEREIEEAQVKGKSGLQEILEDALGEEKALEVLRELEEIFGTASPYRDSVIELLDFEAQLYAVANLRKLMTVRARRVEDENGSRLVYKERVVIGAPTEVVVYVNPIGGITKYQVKWEAYTRPRSMVVGPALLEEIVDRLKAEGLVLSSRIVNDVVAAIVEGFIRRGKATIRTELESPGFYYLDGKLVVVGYRVEEPSKEGLRKALELLDEVATKWFGKVLDRFATVVKWGVRAPFAYAYKQLGKWIKWLYLFGASNTGKTTMAEIATIHMWGLELGRHEKTGASIDTPYRLGVVLSQSTLPVVVNEPGPALSKDEIIDMMKNAVEKPIVRGRQHRGTYVDIPALAALAFTSNKYFPKDEAFLRRLLVLKFTHGEKIPKEKVEEFDRKVKPRLGELRAIGAFIASYALKNGLGEDPEDFSINALREAYREAGLEPPSWLELEGSLESEEEFYEDIRESIRSFLVERVNEEYSRFVGRVVLDVGDKAVSLERTDLSFEERAKVVLEKQLIPWLILKGEVVYVTKGMVEELRGRIGDTTLKDVAELLGWSYDSKHSFREGRKVRNVSVAYTSLEDFLSFLQTKPE